MIKQTCFFTGLALGVFGILALFSFGETKIESNHQWHQELVDRGLAEYYLDEDHQKSWRWLEPEDAPALKRKPKGFNPTGYIAYSGSQLWQLMTNDDSETAWFMVNQISDDKRTSGRIP